VRHSESYCIEYYCVMPVGQVDGSPSICVIVLHVFPRSELTSIAFYHHHPFMMANQSLTPALPPPEGLLSNFLDPPTLMPIAIVGTTIIHIFTLPFIVSRLYVNVRISKEIRIEDYLSYLAYAGCIAYTVAIVRAEMLGMARHMWDIPSSTFTAISHLCNVVFICYTATGGLAKTVVFFQLKKIFTTGHRGIVYWVIVGSLVANIVFYTAMFFLYVFTCWPREKIWNPSIEGRCVDSNKLNMAMGILNVLSDAEAFIVPAWAIWQLNMKLRRKVAVFAVFGAGAM
jgi:hypothetical protein